MVSAGRSRPWLALIPLALLLHAASAGRLSAAAQDDEGFDILAAIKDEVDTMNTNLDELSAAIDSAMTTTEAPAPTTTGQPSPTGQPTGQPSPTSAPTTQPPPTTTTEAPTKPTTTKTPTEAPTTTEPPPPTTTETPTTAETPTTTTPTTTTEAQTTTETTTAEPSTTTTEPTTTETTTPASTSTTVSSTTEEAKSSTAPPLSAAPKDTIFHRQIRDNNQRPMILSRRLLSPGDVPCSTFENIPATLDKAQEALDLVAKQQFANTTLEKLQDSNTELNFTTSCVERKEIKPDDSTAIKEAISAAETSGEAASDTIDHANPTTPTPEDDSGFRSATIALGVLFSLAVVAIAGLAIYAQRQKSGGHMS